MVDVEQPEANSSLAETPAAIVSPPKDPSELVNGPIEGVEYPLKVIYCGNCGMPPEFCMYFNERTKCLTWLEENVPDLFERLSLENKDAPQKGGIKTASSDGPGAASGDGKDSEGPPASGGGKSQKRGGKANKIAKKKESAKRICLSRSNRGKKKYVTLITGLNASYDIDLKDAAKTFASKFACGSSVTGADEIVIQGDVKDDLYDFLLEKWSFIDEDSIEDLGNQAR